MDQRSPAASGHLYGVGVGPGDPDLLTVKARRLVEGCAVVAHFAARGRVGNAWSTVEGLVGPHQEVLRLEYPVTTEPVAPADYEASLARFYDDAAGRVAAALHAGRDVAVVCEGDPFFYGSYMYLHQRLAAHHPTTVVPGVTSFSAAAAAAGRPLVSLDERLAVLPAGLPGDQLAGALAGADAAVVMKVGRRLGHLVDAAEAAGVADRALYVERASCDSQRIVALRDARDLCASYFSLVLVPGAGIDRRWTGR